LQPALDRGAADEKGRVFGVAQRLPRASEPRGLPPPPPAHSSPAPFARCGSAFQPLHHAGARRLKRGAPYSSPQRTTRAPVVERRRLFL